MLSRERLAAIQRLIDDRSRPTSSLSKRRARDSNSQPLSGHHISSVAANHSLTLQNAVFSAVCPAVCPGCRVHTRRASDENRVIRGRVYPRRVRAKPGCGDQGSAGLPVLCAPLCAPGATAVCPGHYLAAGWPLRPFSPARHVHGATGALSAHRPRPAARASRSARASPAQKHHRAEHLAMPCPA